MLTRASALTPWGARTIQWWRSGGALDTSVTSGDGNRTSSGTVRPPTSSADRRGLLLLGVAAHFARVLLLGFFLALLRLAARAAHSFGVSDSPRGRQEHC